MQENKTMKCVTILAPNEIEVKDVPIPKPSKGQVLIKVMAAPINPSDLELFKGNYSHQKKLPTVMGFEGCGTVVENGGGMIGWSLVGKKVAFAIDLQNMGSYSQYTLAKAEEVVSLGSQVSFEQGCMSLINPLTVMGFLDILRQKKEKSVVMTAAASALGRIANRFFPQEGIQVINIVRKEQQVQLLKQQGAKYVLNSSAENFEAQLKQLTHQLKTLTCFEAIGGKMPGIVLRNMPKGSTLTIYGVLSHENLQDIDIGDFLINNKTINSFMLTQWIHTKWQVSLLPIMYKVSKTITTSLKSNVAKTYPIQKAQQAIDYYVNHMTEGKVLIKPWDE